MRRLLPLELEAKHQQAAGGGYLLLAMMKGEAGEGQRICRLGREGESEEETGEDSGGWKGGIRVGVNKGLMDGLGGFGWETLAIC